MRLRILIALGLLALGAAPALADTVSTAIVRAKDMNEATEYASQECGNKGKRAVFMYSEPDKQNEGMYVYYFACK
jgi:hypothetical protein